MLNWVATAKLVKRLATSRTARARFFTSDQTGSGPSQTLVKWIPGLFPGGKAAGVWRWPRTPIQCRVVECRGKLYCPSGPSCPVLWLTLHFMHILEPKRLELRTVRYPEDYRTNSTSTWLRQRIWAIVRHWIALSTVSLCTIFLRSFPGQYAVSTVNKYLHVRDSSAFIFKVKQYHFILNMVASRFFKTSVTAYNSTQL